jgi:hypothetical protein
MSFHRVKKAQGGQIYKAGHLPSREQNVQQSACMNVVHLLRVKNAGNMLRFAVLIGDSSLFF